MTQEGGSGGRITGGGALSLFTLGTTVCASTASALALAAITSIIAPPGTPSKSPTTGDGLRCASRGANSSRGSGEVDWAVNRAGIMRSHNFRAEFRRALTALPKGVSVSVVNRAAGGVTAAVSGGGSRGAFSLGSGIGLRIGGVFGDRLGGAYARLGRSAREVPFNCGVGEPSGGGGEQHPSSAAMPRGDEAGTGGRVTRARMRSS